MLEQQTRSIVSIEDPALDRVKMDVDGYAKTRNDALVCLLPGQKPRRYIVRRLTRAEVNTVGGLGVMQKVDALIAFGLVRIDEPGGEVTKPTREIPRVDRKAGTQTIWDDGDELDAIYNRVQLSEWHELAAVIETMAGMRMGEAYGSSDERFTLLPSSQLAVARLKRLAAARTPTT